MLLYLGVVVDEILKIVLRFEDPFRYQVIKDDTHGGRGRGVVSVGQPGDFGRFLVVRVREGEFGFKTHDNTTRGVPAGNTFTQVKLLKKMMIYGIFVVHSI